MYLRFVWSLESCKQFREGQCKQVPRSSLCSKSCARCWDWLSLRSTGLARCLPSVSSLVRSDVSEGHGIACSSFLHQFVDTNLVVRGMCCLMNALSEKVLAQSMSAAKNPEKQEILQSQVRVGKLLSSFQCCMYVRRNWVTW